LIISSVITLRLNRRRAFSSDSPSCSRTSAILITPMPSRYRTYQSLLPLQRGQLKLSARRRARQKKEARITPSSHRRSCRHHHLHPHLPSCCRLRLPHLVLGEGGDQQLPKDARGQNRSILDGCFSYAHTPNSTLHILGKRTAEVERAASSCGSLGPRRARLQPAE